MRKIETLIVALDKGETLKPSELMRVEAHMNALATKEVGNGKVSVESGAFSKMLNVTAGLASLTVDKIRAGKEKLGTIGEEHANKTKKEKIEDLNAELDVLAGKLRRREIDQNVYDEKAAEVQADLDTLAEQ